VKKNIVQFLGRLVLMAIQDIVEAIDAEIYRLEKVRSLLEASPSKTTTRTTSSTRTTRAAKVDGRARKRVLSPEAIERIRAAQKKRWAKAARAKKA
jgi:hypothetical protein